MTPRRPRWAAVLAVLALVVCAASLLKLQARDLNSTNTASASHHREVALATSSRQTTTTPPPPTTSPPPPPVTTPPTVATTTTTVQKATVAPVDNSGMSPDQALDLQLVNQTRANAGVGPVTWNPYTSAQSWADHLAATHGGEDDPGFANGPGCGHAGNFAMASSVQEAHDALVASPPHYANMTGNYATVGIGVSHDSGNTYVVEDYTRPC